MHKNKVDKYNSIGICKFAVNKLLDTRETMALTNNNLPYNLIPKKFMGIFVTNKTFDEVVRIASENAINICLKEITREERYRLRNEKKRHGC